MNERDENYAYSSAVVSCMTATGTELFGYDKGQGPTFPLKWSANPSWQPPKVEIVTPGQAGFIFGCSADGKVLAGTWELADGNWWCLYRKDRGLTKLTDYIRDELGITAAIPVDFRRGGYNRMRISDDGSTIALYGLVSPSGSEENGAITIIRKNTVAPKIDARTILNAGGGEIQITIAAGYLGCRLQKQILNTTEWLSAADVPETGLEYKAPLEGKGMLFRMICE